jgi:hypothetical protein
MVLIVVTRGMMAIGNTQVFDSIDFEIGITGSSALINQVLRARDVHQDDDRAANGICDPPRELADR